MRVHGQMQFCVEPPFRQRSIPVTLPLSQEPRRALAE